MKYFKGELVSLKKEMYIAGLNEPLGLYDWFVSMKEVK